LLPEPFEEGLALLQVAEKRSRPAMTVPHSATRSLRRQRRV